MTMQEILLSFCIFFFFLTPNLDAQQRYPGTSVSDCSSKDNEEPSTSVLYICNSQNPSCRAFLIFISHPPYDSVPTISHLMSSDQSELAQINNVSRFTIFPTYKEVIVPVNCSCSGPYYQANSSYVIKTEDETYFIIAKDTYQGLSSCTSLMVENNFSPSNLSSGLELIVPLRCACPTRNQTSNGIKYLLTYQFNLGDNVFILSKRFNVSQDSTRDANGFSEKNPTIHPLSTILIPLTSEPSSSQTVIHFPQPVSPPISNSKNKKSRKGLRINIVAVSVGSSLTILCVVAVLSMCFVHHRRRKIKGQEERKQGMKCVPSEDLHASIAGVEKILKVYTYEELCVATNNFSYECKIRGSVYRGEVSGNVLAIKRMTQDASKEVKILSKINHFNLIRLYGICIGQQNCYLVYEYMENGSLRDWLSDRTYLSVRSWKRRIQIALDIANALHYLHNFTDPAHVHKNIKSSNILLDGNLRARVANFGLARNAARHESNSVLTKNIVGTKGYMAPEYLETGLVTPKLDIYAFGVVMLELITGKGAIIKSDKGERFLSRAIISIFEGGNTEVELGDLMDASLHGAYHMDLAKGVAKLSVACLRQDPARRPSMDEVVSTLSRILVDSQMWESYTVESFEAESRKR